MLPNLEVETISEGYLACDSSSLEEKQTWGRREGEGGVDS